MKYTSKELRDREMALLKRIQRQKEQAKQESEENLFFTGNMNNLLFGEEPQPVNNNQRPFTRLSLYQNRRGKR